MAEAGRMTTSDRPIVGLGDVLQAYDQLDETGREVFTCALLHVWSAQCPRIMAREAPRSGGHWRDWGAEVLALPRCLTFGRALDLPVPGTFLHRPR